MNGIWLWLETNRYIVGTISIIIGVILTLTQHQIGPKMKIITYFLISATSSEIICFAILYIFLLATETNSWIGWTVYSCSLVISLAFMYVSWKYHRFVALQIGALMGFFFGLVL